MLLLLSWLVVHHEAITVKVCLYCQISGGRTHIYQVLDNIYWPWTPIEGWKDYVLRSDDFAVSNPLKLL